MASAPIQQMMTKVTSVFDAKIEAMGFDKIRSIVEVDLVDGRTYVQPSDDRYRGSPDWPWPRMSHSRRRQRSAKAATCPSHIREVAP